MMSDERRFTATNIGNVLREQGRMQSWLALKLGVSGAAVNRWSRGQRTVDEATAIRISEILNVPFYLLFDIPKGLSSNPNSNEEAA